jgi:hypothetical protein
MTAATYEPIPTVELIAWDLDQYQFRPETFECNKLVKARELVARRLKDHSSSALCEEEIRRLRDTIDRQQARPDLHAEMQGLDWSLGIVDLRHLLAFQRRLSFHPKVPLSHAPRQSDWGSLFKFSFASPASVICDVVHDAHTKTVTLQSSNPNLHLRVGTDHALPVAVHAGSPFFEVAEYAGRWFLRDGYHRAYHLLQAGVFQLPAVIVRARTLEELGAVHPWFFPEAILLSEHPPFISDFLDERLTIEYDRPPTITTLRITMEESVTSLLPAFLLGERS